MKYQQVTIFAALLFIILTISFSGCTVAEDTDLGESNIEKYIGTWNVLDQSARINYTVEINANPSNSAEILLHNFADLGSTAIGLVVENSIVIDAQSMSSDYTVNGSGSYINSDKITFNFNLNDGIDIELRIATYTK